MGLVAAIQGLNQSAWPRGELGQSSAASKSATGRARVLNPGAIETPEEALTYIQQLYQDGRTDELVGLLRSNPVFREAWQTLQQSSSNGSDAAANLAATPAAAAAPAESTLPVPAPSQLTSQDPNTALIIAAPAFSPAIQTTPNYPVPTPKPTFAQAAGRRAYESQARYFAKDGGNSSQISIRV